MSPLSPGSNLTHRLFHSLSLYRHLRMQLSELGAIATKAVQANTIAAEVALQRGEISGLAVAAQQQIERTSSCRPFSAASVLPTLVAFESLIQRTPL